MDLVTSLDHGRSKLLRITMSLPVFRPIFLNRSARLGVLFLMSFGVSLILSLVAPLWVLALGPAIYGVPHLFSSLRYFHYTIVSKLTLNKNRHNIQRVSVTEKTPSLREENLPFSSVSQTKNSTSDAVHSDSRTPNSTSDTIHSDSRALNSDSQKKILFLVTSLMILIPLYRIGIGLNYLHLDVPSISEWSGSLYLEFFALVLTFIIGIWIYKIQLKRSMLGVVFLVPIAVGFWFEPFFTIGALVLIHNFIAFVYWILAAKSPAEKSVASLASLSVVGVTWLIFIGTFDSFQSIVRVSDVLPFARLELSEIGNLVAPWSQSLNRGLHCATAYAFGQSIHYFVWLKAIPDQHHYHEVPTSFRQSLSLLEKDFGKRGTQLILTLSFISIFIWVIFEFPQARMIYFSLAGYHGYLEIAGLALWCSKSELI